jgi:hypothetical protein
MVDTKKVMLEQKLEGGKRSPEDTWIKTSR